MGYQLASAVDVLALINAANSSSLASTDITFSAPKPVAGSAREGLTNRNTAIQVTAGASSQYQGSVVIVYDRLNLASLASIPGFSLKAYQATKVSDLFAAIKYYTGIPFDTTDLQDLATGTDGGGNPTATLTAQTNSIGWYGSITLNIATGGVALDSKLTTGDLTPGFNYPTANPGTDTMGPVYMYPYDFTTYTSTLLNIVSGVLSSTNADSLVTMFKALDQGTGATLWNNTAGSTTWSLNGATVVSNGLNSASLPTNPAYKYVMVLQLAGTVTTPTGLLYLHYNDPFNANNF